MSEKSRQVPRWFSCLVKGPLGCMAFLFGAGVVLVLFLPAACGRLLDRSLEDWFAAQHAGTLELDEAWLGSFYGPQTIGRLVLRDPEGEEVLRASLRAPSLGGLIGDRPPSYGPVEVRVSMLRVIAGEDGRTGLARALEREAGGPPPDLEGLRIDAPLTIDFTLWIERLRFAGADRNGATLENLCFQGRLVWEDERLALTCEGGADTLAAPAPRARLDASRTGAGAAWERRAALQEAPALLVGLLLGSGDALEDLLGPRLDEVDLRWKRAAGAGLELEELRCVQGASSLLARGSIAGGELTGGEGALRLRLAPDAPATRGLLRELVPVAASIELVDPAQTLELVASDIAWSLAGDPQRGTARLELNLPAARLALEPRAGGLLGAPTDTLELLPARLVAELRGSRLAFDEQRLPLSGGSLSLSGTYELGQRAFGGLSAALELGGRESRAVLDGPRFEPSLALPPTPPERPLGSGGDG
jgi:hypothetical protein